MSFPAFFAQVVPISLCDPLAAALGAAEGGVIEYGYADAVKWAGHSCPTVAGAWLMTATALRYLYGDALPDRGGIRVELREAAESGTAGVTGGVMGLIVGAAGDGGFKGLAGRFSRRDLLKFGVELAGEARFTRLDTGASVTVSYDPSGIKPDPDMPPLMQKLLAGQADETERMRFSELWQDRVRRLLSAGADTVVRIHP